MTPLFIFRKSVCRRAVQSVPKPQATGIIFKMFLDSLLLRAATRNRVTSGQSNLAACELWRRLCELNIQSFCSAWVAQSSCKHPKITPQKFRSEEHDQLRTNWRYSTQFKHLVQAHPLQLRKLRPFLPTKQFLYLGLIQEFINASTVFYSLIC